MNLSQPIGGVMHALAIAMDAHKDQKDKGGNPYILHPLEVAINQKTDEAAIVALLHDVVEDSDYSLEELAFSGFSGRVIEALKLLTHEEGVSYEDYIKAIKENELAKAVKIADLTHNLDESRLKPWKTHEEYLKRAERRRKYKNALSVLLEISTMVDCGMEEV